jgi:tRNA(Ser,Leu) C12 N-acetylase TAN1
MAKEIVNRVDLGYLDWGVLVEVIKRVAGISVLKPAQIFSSVLEEK